MNSFTIRDIENLTGIKAHTLRIWEQRYGIITPKRKESKHRQYDNEDLKTILRIAYLYHHGYKISKIAMLKEDEIKKLTLEYNSAGSYEVFINQLMEASIDLDQDKSEKALNSMVLHLGFEKSMYHVVYPFLEKIGLFWITGHIIPAQEHFASNHIRKMMLVATDGLDIPAQKSKRNVIVFAPENEYHEIPLLLVNYLLKKNQVSTAYLGAGVALKEIECYLQARSATHLYCHIITNLTEEPLEKFIEKLAARFSPVQVVFSGPVVLQLDENYNLPNVKILRSLKEVIQFCGEKE